MTAAAMQRDTGYVWHIQWPNPYTSPPNDMPRIVAEMFVPAPEDGGGAGSPPREIAEYPRPRGYSVTVAHVSPPARRLSREQLAALRRRRLEQRERATHPLFADLFVAESLAQKAGYYEGEDERQDRLEALAALQERYEYLAAHRGELLVYWHGEQSGAA